MHLNNSEENKEIEMYKSTLYELNYASKLGFLVQFNLYIILHIASSSESFIFAI